jgi:hypothetical protein
LYLVSDTFDVLNTLIMTQLALPLYSWDNGAFIMIGVFALVIIGLVGIVMMMMNSKNKKND